MLHMQKKERKGFWGQTDLGNGYIISPSKRFIMHLCIGRNGFQISLYIWIAGMLLKNASPYV